MAKMRAMCSIGCGIGVRAAADQVGAFAAGLDQQLLGAGVVEQAFLREHADLEVDGPGEIARELADGAEPFQADARVHLDMGAHVHGAAGDSPLQRATGPLDDVFLGEGAAWHAPSRRWPL